MSEYHWINKDIAHGIHAFQLKEHGGSRGVRDVGLLESALNRPINLHHYNPEASIFELAAAYCYGVVKNHPFVDGNKRTGLAIALTFLQIYGYKITASEPELVVMVVDLASGEMPEEEFAKWLKRSSAIDKI